MRQSKQQKQREQKLAESIAAHKRFAELEKELDAMYDRPDAYEREWSNEQFEKQCELENLRERLENE